MKEGATARSDKVVTLVVSPPLTEAELVQCSSGVIAKLARIKSKMTYFVEREELEAMAREAVVIADRTYQPNKASRKTWAVTKGTYLVMDMIRSEARHTVCLTSGEFNGMRLDGEGNRIAPRKKIALGESQRGVNDRETSPELYLRATAPPPWLGLHSQQLRKRFDRALDALPDQRAALAFRMTIFQESTQAEVGELLGISAARVSQLLTQWRPRLCLEFSDLAPEQRAA